MVVNPVGLSFFFNFPFHANQFGPVGHSPQCKDPQATVAMIVPWRTGVQKIRNNFMITAADVIGDGIQGLYPQRSSREGRKPLRELELYQRSIRGAQRRLTTH